MSTQRKNRRPGWIGRRAALATAVITALAIAAPGAEASASVARDAVAIGPTLIGDTFNGGTAIVTSPSPAVATVIGTP
jgi:hypothetical protein